jgi:3-oxoisoapionate kinase
LTSGTFPDGLLVAAYGDDFTGSAAVMEVLSFAGLPCALFLDLPTPSELSLFPGLRGIVVAGTARSHGPNWMAAHLPRIFRGLSELGAELTHYKVCSTLDSSPSLGSIGLAVELALPQFRANWVPCLIAAPAIRRYQAFGHLFAAGPGGVFRLDRHPVMARHPVTPMDEADVARHLSRQTTLALGVLTVEDLRSTVATRAALARLQGDGARVVCLDTLDEEHLARCGELIWKARSQADFCVGSQGVEYALVAHWRATGALAQVPPPAGIGRARGMIAVSGSVSPTTAAQIEWSLRNGFEGIAVDAAALVAGGGAAEAAINAACRAAHAALAQGRDPLLYTARGPDDPAVTALPAARAAAGISAEEANARIGTQLGTALVRLVRETGIRRAVISGGDTSGHATRQLGIFALTALAPTIPGAAVFRAHARDPALDGLELALKGGQMGSEDYFGWVREGGGERPSN